MKKICFVVSSIYTVNGFLLNHIEKLSESNEVTVIANTMNSKLAKDNRINYEIISVPIERRIHPYRDFQALLTLTSLFRKRKFHIVHSVSPKAGLLSMTAARLANVPIRIHTFTGQVWVTEKGLMRRILKLADISLVRFATHILVDSPSQLIFLLEEKVLPRRKAKVLANGSINGVDMKRFRPNPEVRSAVRTELGIPRESIVYMFLGRLNRDKGLLVLAQAFRTVCENTNGVHLLVIGPDEQNMRTMILEQVRPYSQQVHIIDHTLDPERYMAAADILCLPSFREGFGNVIIEAAAVGLPAIGSRIYGIEDAIIDGETGLLHEAGDSGGLEACMNRLYHEPLLRKRLGDRAQRRVQKDFRQETVTSALIDYYNAISE